MPWPTGCRCRPVIHNFLCLCVCVCVPPPLACQQDMALSEIRDLPSLSPPLGLCPLSASAASAQFEKQSSKSIITACAIRCWRLFCPLPLGTWLKATRISVSGLFLQPSATTASPLRPSTPPSACAIAQFLWHRVSSPYLRQRRRRRRLQLCKLPAR